jgi:hypothetical protein
MDPLSNFPSSSDTTWCNTETRERITLDSATAKGAQTSVSSVSTLVSQWKTLSHYPALVVVITKKSQLQCIGNTGEKQQFPFQAYLRLEDSTGAVSAVLWYSVCRDYYYSLDVGDVIVVSDYRVKAATAFSQAFTDAHLELSLNSKNPTATINIIRPSDVHLDLSLPILQDIYRLVPRPSLTSLADDTYVGFAGMVTYLGRPERELVRKSTKHFWTYRWIQVTDNSSVSVPIKLYSCGYQQEFESLRVGMMFIACNLRVGSFVIGQSPKRHIHLTTSHTTQYFAWFSSADILADSNPFLAIPHVREVAEWAHTRMASLPLTAYAIGGYTSLPVPASARLTRSDLRLSLVHIVISSHVRS